MDDDSDFHEELELEADTADVTALQADYYDPAYYDSDEDAPTDDSEEEQWSDVDEQSASSSTKRAQSKTQPDPVMEDITRRMKASSMSNASEALGKKIQRKHRVKSNDELLYDPDQDSLDQEWLFSKIAENRPKGTKREDIWTDAILVCPMCWATLCYDCQQHEFYPHQFRAMFVENCRTVENELLRFPKPAPSKAQQQKKTKNTPSPTDPVQNSSDPTLQFQPDDSDSPDVVYHPVVCESCNTKVAVVDSDEIYHFFHVIASDICPLKA